MGCFWRGCRAVSPLLPGVLPFAMIAGTTAIQLNMSLFAALSLSWIVFAGASQLAILAMLETQAPGFVVILTALAINLRFSMYSATLAPHLKELGGRKKALFAYLLTDQAFLLSLQQYENKAVQPHAFYLGAATTLWLIWQLGTATGVALGRGLPEIWSLDFAVPLSFLALLVPAIKNKAGLAAALTAGITILWTRHLPLQLGLIAATILGVAAGVFYDRSKP